MVEARGQNENQARANVVINCRLILFIPQLQVPCRNITGMTCQGPAAATASSTSTKVHAAAESAAQPDLKVVEQTAIELNHANVTEKKDGTGACLVSLPSRSTPKCMQLSPNSALYWAAAMLAASVPRESKTTGSSQA